ncbi:MbtH family NRPS accessory protein [Streptomyces albicerus]|uniref:MbtH family NRPS accessory protein n=1 Tax=Streptomyces albicerus TaxID=2569859 RepID=UPI00124B78E1|nr:MbtH family NRPS accessory protein [Streptomyces albicerus]
MLDEAVPDRARPVVVNEGSQHSVWRAGAEAGAARTVEAVSGTEQVCLAHIDRVRSAVRPLGVRRAAERPSSV